MIGRDSTRKGAERHHFHGIGERIAPGVGINAQTLKIEHGGFDFQRAFDCTRICTGGSGTTTGRISPFGDEISTTGYP
jgi:hypothetical protein